MSLKKMADMMPSLTTKKDGTAMTQAHKAFHDLADTQAKDDKIRKCNIH